MVLLNGSKRESTSGGSLALLAVTAAVVLNPAHGSPSGFSDVRAGGGGVIGFGFSLGLSFGILGEHVGHGFDIPFLDNDDDEEDKDDDGEDDDKDDDEEKNVDNGTVRIWWRYLLFLHNSRVGVNRTSVGDALATVTF